MVEASGGIPECVKVSTRETLPADADNDTVDAKCRELIDAKEEQVDPATVPEDSEASTCRGTTMLPLSASGADDFQTPAFALEPLFPYLKPEWKIWEPAMGEGNLVAGLRVHGYQVEGSDIKTGHDFLVSKRNCDAIVTNPPYSLKLEFLKRCYELGKPFALLLPLTALETKARQKLFRQHGVEIVLFPERIKFVTPTKRKSSPWFSVAWFTHGLNIGQPLTFSGVIIEVDDKTIELLEEETVQPDSGEMRGIGFDTSAEYCAAAQNRLDKMQNAQMSSEEGIQGQLTHGAEGFANLLLTTKRGAADLEHKAFSDLLKNASMGYYQRRPVKAHWEHAVWFCAHGGVGTLIHCRC